MLEEVGVRGFLGFLKWVVVGVAVAAGARAVYRNREKLKGGWKALGEGGVLKGRADKLSVSKLLESVGSLRDLAGQVTRLKKVM
jgi:hypothetical protein